MALLAQDLFPSLPTTGSDLALTLSELDAGDATAGFEGAVSNLTLSDVIQLEGQNRFSGSVLVVYQEQEGQVFFLDGEVVHAEVGNLIGEEAFHRIMSWPGGSFRLHPNVTCLRHSIQKRREHLLLSAHQWLDESRHGVLDPRVSTPPEAISAHVPATRSKDIMQTICEVPGVSLAVFMEKNGVPRGDVGARGEALAAKGLYLATMICTPIGEVLGLGDMKAAAMHAGPEKVLLFKSRGTYLSVSLTQEGSPEEVELGIRQALSARKDGQ